MSHRDGSASACILGSYDCCQSFHPGHNMHWIHARHVGESPWGWRDGVVSAADAAGFVAVEYVLESGRVEAWHHSRIVGNLAKGKPVRVHEGYRTLSSPMGWIHLLISSGLGAVPEPAHTDPWVAEVTGGVVDLATGRGLALDHQLGEDGQDDGAVWLPGLR